MAVPLQDQVPAQTCLDLEVSPQVWHHLLTPLVPRQPNIPLVKETLRHKKNLTGSFNKSIT